MAPTPTGAGSFPRPDTPAWRSRRNELSLWINDVAVYQNGMPVPFDAEGLSQSIKSQRNVHLRLVLNAGVEAVRFWTCDLTAEYIRLNADYTT